MRTVEVNCQFGPFSFHLMQQEPLERDSAAMQASVDEMQPIVDLSISPPATLTASAAPPMPTTAQTPAPVTKPYSPPKRNRAAKAMAAQRTPELDSGTKDSLGLATLWQGAGHKLKCPRPQGLHCTQEPGAHVRIVGLYKRHSHRTI